MIYLTPDAARQLTEGLVLLRECLMGVPHAQAARLREGTERLLKLIPDYDKVPSGDPKTPGFLAAAEIRRKLEAFGRHLHTEEIEEVIGRHFADWTAHVEAVQAKTVRLSAKGQGGTEYILDARIGGLITRVGTVNLRPDLETEQREQVLSEIIGRPWPV